MEKSKSAKASSDASPKRQALEREKLMAEVAQVILPQLALKLVHDGILAIDGKDDVAIEREVVEHAIKVVKSPGFRVGMIVDHSSSLLAEARMHARQGNFELAILFYATFFEHMINLIVAELCTRKKLAPEETKSILREGLAAKCTWLMKLLGAPPITQLWLKRINQITEQRNSFVHYKWPVEDDADDKTRRGEWLRLAERS